MEEEKQSSEKLIEIIRSQPNPEEYAEMLLMVLESADEKGYQFHEMWRLS